MTHDGAPASATPPADEPGPNRSSAVQEVEPLDCPAVLTHHWLVRRRGGERVLEALRALLPGAPVYTLVYDPGGFHTPPDAPAWERWDREAVTVHTSWLQHVPGVARHYPKLLPLMPSAARRMMLPPADLVVCSDAAIAKAMTPAGGSRVVCYCHSPMRYAWDLAGTYRDTLPALLRPFWGPVVRRLRRVDRAAADRVDRFVANSRHVAARIRRHYHRDAVVIYPPVDLPERPATAPRDDYYLCVGQHVPYKRLDLAVAACRRLRRRLVVVGAGPDVRRLRERDDPYVQFAGYQPEAVVQAHYRRARALLFPGEEDFGIVPVEAMGHGCPVIAFGVGGATESVVDGLTGVWFERQTVDCLMDAILRCEAATFDARVLHAHARQFGRGRFLRQMRDLLVETLENARRE